MGKRFPEANKSFGQHFLHSPQVIKKITGPLPEGIDAIVEVGPGPAVLTPLLSNYKLPLFVIEMDERFVPLLEKVIPVEKIFRQDALEFNWDEFLEKNSFKNIWLVSNLPYNVSVPLTLAFLRIKSIKHMTLMYQKEVAQKILPNDPRNAMNSLHVMMKAQFDLTHITYVPPGAFIPPPKVDSQVLGFKRKSESDIPLGHVDDFEKFLRLVFSQKRKQLGGLLKNAWGAQKTEHLLKLEGLSPMVRAEALSYQEVLSLFRANLKSSIESK